MSKVGQVLKNKNKREKEFKQKKNQELSDMRLESAYRSKLYEEMRKIDILLEDETVESVIVDVPNNFLSQFLKAIYSEEMSEYTVIQKDTNKFSIGRKIVNF